MNKSMQLFVENLGLKLFCCTIGYFPFWFTSPLMMTSPDLNSVSWPAADRAEYFSSSPHEAAVTLSRASHPAVLIRLSKNFPLIPVSVELLLVSYPDLG